MGSIADRVLGTACVSRGFAAATEGRLRVLAYHDVDDVAAFTRQIGWLVEHFTPVSAEQVVASIRDGRALPSRSVWVTFDDGRPEVVTRAQPVLARFGVAGTVFVCPGLVDSSSPYWWEIVERAGAAGVLRDVGGGGTNAADVISELKRVPDAHRREMVGRLDERLASNGPARAMRQLTTDELRAWLEGGHTMGNHTWDHPCLDMCTPQQQADQISKADAWLRELAPTSDRLFAYPNGDWTADAQRVLQDLGYGVAVMFDHRLAGNPPRRWRTSRLRVSAGASIARFRAIVSGANPALFGLRRSRVKAG